jgi:hypothetical protein
VRVNASVNACWILLGRVKDFEMTERQLALNNRADAVNSRRRHALGAVFARLRTQSVDALRDDDWDHAKRGKGISPPPTEGCIQQHAG